LKFPALDPDKAYRTGSLFLPTSKVAEKPVYGAMTFEASDGTDRVLVSRHPHHLEIPREGFSAEQLGRLGIDVIALTPSTFDPVSIRPKPGSSLRPDQEGAAKALRSVKNGVLNVGCGKGKTYLGWYKACLVGAPTLVISPQVAHLENWLVELNLHFDFSGTVGWIQGKKMEWDKDIVLSTVQTLAKRCESGSLPPEFHRRFGLTIYDECHYMSAEWFSLAANVSHGPRLGLTATVNRADMNEGIFLAHLGPVFYEDLEQDLQPEFVVVDTCVFPSSADKKKFLDRSGMRHCGLIRAWLAKHPYRNSVITSIVDKVIADGRTVYCLSHGPDHVEHLHGLYKNTSTVIHGGTPAKDRLDRLNGADLVFATLGVGKEAYNRKDLDTLLLLTPFSASDHAATSFDQSVGRILRSSPGKKDPVVYLFRDESIPECAGMIGSLLKAARKRGYKIREYE